MSEGAMWEALRPLVASLDPVRIESPMSSGVPDVNYREGWIELKYKAEWPKRATTPLRIDHFTREQRVWLVRRRKAGGRAFLLLKVGEDEWLLFDGLLAAVYVGKVPRAKLYEIAAARWTRRPKSEEICSCLV